jgi:Transglycosylase SLT domain
MAKMVALPDGSTGSFPDDLPDSDIVDVISRQFPGNRSSDIPAVRQKESRGNVNAYNTASQAEGDMQVRPATNAAPGFGVRPAADDSPAERSRVGEDYISALQGKYGRAGGLMAYNWGPGKFEKWQAAGADPAKVPLETQDYVHSITGKTISEHFAQAGNAPSSASGPYRGPSATGYKDNDPDAPPFAIEVRGVGSSEATPQAEQTAPPSGGQPAYDGADAQTLHDLTPPKEKPDLRETIKSLLQPPEMPDFTALGQDAGAGIVRGAAHLGNLVAAPVELGIDAYQGKPMGTTREAAGKQIDTDTAGIARDPSSFAFNAASMAPEMMVTGGPIAGAGKLIASKLPLALGRLSPFLGDVAANAGYASGRAALTGEDPAQAAMYGAGGAAGARVLTRTLGGVGKPWMSQEARHLLDAGVTPTPGNLFSGVPGAVARTAEDVASGVGGVGNVIDYSRNSAQRQYVRAETRAAMEPIASTADKLPRAKAAIKAAYERAKAATWLDPTKAQAAAQQAYADSANIPLLTSRQRALFGRTLFQKVQSISQGGRISGETAKALDAELGDYANRYRTSAVVGERPLGEAFARAQKALRDVLEGDAAAMRSADTAYSRFIPLKKAGANATPQQIGKRQGDRQTPLNEAAQEALPAGSGRIGHSLQGVGVIGALLTGHGVHGAALTALTAALYSRPAVSFIVNGMGGLLPKATRDYIATLPPARAIQYLDELSVRYPHLVPQMQQAVAQLGRQVAQQQQPEEATQ